MASSLAQLNVPLPVSEVHGLCCGLICAMPSATAKTRWFTELLDAASMSPDDVASKAAQLKSLDAWFGQSLATMNDTDLEFSPLLPEDAAPVSERIRALSDFCAGFTYGIGLSLAGRSHSALPADSREIIEDFQSIDAADSTADADEHGVIQSIEEQEGVYVELLEYVRVGVLLILEELRPVSPVLQETLS